jgi:hypothetical protein
MFDWTGDLRLPHGWLPAIVSEIQSSLPNGDEDLLRLLQV